MIASSIEQQAYLLESHLAPTTGSDKLSCDRITKLMSCWRIKDIVWQKLLLILDRELIYFHRISLIGVFESFLDFLGLLEGNVCF